MDYLANTNCIPPTDFIIPFTSSIVNVAVTVIVGNSDARIRSSTWRGSWLGKTTPDNPVGIVIGATPDFLQAVQFSLEAAMSAAQGKPPHVARREYNQ
jgi:hypothetical protein